MNSNTSPDDDAASDLRDRVDRAVPPMSLNPDAVLATARTRRRRRTAAQLTTGALAIVAVIVGAVQVGALDGGRTVPADPASDRTNLGPGPDGADPSVPDSTTEPSPVELGPYRCGGHQVSPAEIEADRPATDLSPASLTALKSMDLTAGPDWASWTVLEETDMRITLIRPAPNGSGLGVPQYEMYGIELVPPGRGGLPFNDTDEPIWSVSEQMSCTVRADLSAEGLSDVTLFLDPKNPPVPEATSVVVLVIENGCTGRADPTDRLRLVGVGYSDTTVDLAVGAEPLALPATCNGPNPVVRYTVELDEPIGDRILVDATIYPIHQLPMAPEYVVDPAGTGN